MWYLLLGVPIVLLGLCSIAAAIAGGRADRMIEQRQTSTVHKLPAAQAGAREPSVKALG